MNRRQLLRGLAVLPLARWAAAQTAPPKLTVTKLSDSLSMISGDGGNIGVLTGGDGLMMIDGGYAQALVE